MTSVHEIVPAALDGQRIDRVVAMLTGLSRAESSLLITDGGVVVDGQAVSRGADRLRVDQAVVIDLPEPVIETGPGPDASIEFTVVFADDQVIVVDKPADLVVHPGAGHEADTLVNGLLDRFPEVAHVGDPQRPGIVHRLDRGTSGLMVVARSQAAYESLVGQLGRRSVERRYRALVWEHLDSPRGLVDAAVGRSPRHPTKMAVTTDGKEARTRYEVDRAFHIPTPTSLLVCRLETGRTHQIRVHLSAIGHPVVGDDRYQGVRQTIPLGRPFLHAEHLGFTHPTSGELLSFDSALPAELQAVLDSLS